ncbi:MAG: OB-fold nucleic acid binding domain-containing protein, partial [Janthinobacterium lividum]
GMVGKGYERAFAERTFSQLEGFGSYGFPESHAASFALIAYASSWMKCHHPDIFCAALLNAQPMGFYAPAQVVRDAREHGVEIRPVCVNASRWDCTLEPRRDRRRELAVRLGLRMAKGLAEQHGVQLVVHRGDAFYHSVEEVWRRADIPAIALERLAEADAFQSIGLDRRQALWQVKGLADHALPLFAAADAGRRPQPELVEPPVELIAMKNGREVVEDYRSVGLSLRAHPMSFLRPTLQARQMVTCADLNHIRDRRRIIVSGIVLVRQKPGSAKGVMFITVEDETGVANLILWKDRFEAQRRLVLSAGMIACHGRVQREGTVIHVVTDRLEDLTELLRSVGERDEAFPIQHGRGDGMTHPATRDPRQAAAAGPGGRPARDIYIPDLRIGSGIKVPTRDFR